MQVFLWELIKATKSGGNFMKRISLEKDRKIMLSVGLPVQQILETRTEDQRHKYYHSYLRT